MIFVIIEKMFIILIKNNEVNEITGSTHIGLINSYRYRSYRYDNETGLYYLNSRYYNPEVGRFINADDVDVLDEEDDSLLLYNLYAYVFNNPVNMHDPDGNFGWFAIPAVYYGNTAIIFVIGTLMTPQGKMLISNVVTGVYSIATSIASKNSNVLQSSKKGTKAKKQTKLSAKEKATDAPSWAKSQTGFLKRSQTAQKNATDLLNKKYGLNNWGKGPNSEFNKIVKWLQRALGYR